MRLFDTVRRVVAGIGEAKHLRLARLRLQNIGREVRRAGERIRGLTGDLGAKLLHDRGGIFDHRVARDVVGRDEEPAVAAGFH